MLSLPRNLISLSLMVAGTLFLGGCASTAASTQTVASSTPTSTEITSSSLLDKQATDVLEQVLTYPGASQAQVSSSIITIPVGAETGLHQHEAPMYAYVLEGELTVTYDDGTINTYKPGQAIMEAVGTAHNGKSTGTTPVKVLVVNIGADGVANTVKLP